MRRHALRTLAALVAAAVLAPADAGALEWQGRLGLQYLRDDQWVGPARTTTPRLDVNLGLDLAGFVVSPAVFGYGGGVDYRRTTVTQPGERESQRDTLNYRLRSSFFTHPSSPVGVTLQATQTEDDLSGGGADRRHAQSVARTYGADLQSIGFDRPTLRAGYTRSERVFHLPGVPDDDRTMDSVLAQVTHGAANFSYSGRYRGNYSTGSSPLDDYADHQVDVDASAHVSEATELRVSDVFTRRDPQTLSGFNPRQELNTLTAALSYRPGAADFHTGTYLYSHAVQSNLLLADTERTFHRLGYQAQRELADGAWRLRGNLDATAAIDRYGTTEQNTLGQTAGALAQWRPIRDPDRTWELRAGPTVGILEPAGASATFGYGGTAGTTWTRALSRLTGNASYDLNYAKDIGYQGWSFRQDGTGMLEAPVWTARARAQVTLSAERRETRFMGTGGSRAVSVGGALGTRRFDVNANLSYAAGLANPVANPGVGDGLFLALPYDTRTLSGSVGFNAALLNVLRFGATGRLTSSVAPGRVSRSESEVRARLEYAVGLLRLSLEDRYLVVSAAGNTVRYNQFMVMATRIFGSL